MYIMYKVFLLILSCLALVGWAQVTPYAVKLHSRDKYDVNTTNYLTNVNNAIYTISKQTTPTNIYQMIIDALRLMQKVKVWIPCATDIVTVLAAVRGGLQEMWALRMIDSGTKLPSGILEGNIVDLGQFDECINEQHGNITGQHCLLNFVFHLPSGDKNPNLAMLGGSITLTMSQCFPASCEPYMLRFAFGEIAQILTNLLSSTNVTVTVDIPDTDCHTQYSRTGPDATEITVLVILVLLVMIVSAMTVVDYLLISKRLGNRKPSKAELSVQAFSAYTNGLKLFSLKQNPDQMNCINGMKFLSIGWVALGHRYRYAVTVPLVNLLVVPKMIESWSKMVILNAILSVDTFFVISGLLNAYGFCTIRDKIKCFGVLNVLHSFVHRYIRLTPAYLVMIGMTATWIYRVGDGPIWDRLVGTERNHCRESFWANLVYLNNYLTPDENCMMQSWYLAADMQMFWLSPLVIYPLWRWPVFGYVYIVILAGFSVAAPVCVAYFYDITTPIPVTTDPVEESKEMDKLYFPTHTKTISYVVGIFVGYILYRIRVKKNMRIRMSKWTAMIGWVLALLSMLYALFGGHYLFLPSHPYNLIESSLYIGFFRLFWGLGVGWVIFACSTGYGGLVDKFLSLNIFGPLGRLTYCIYLTHIFMILYKFGSMRTAIYLSDYDMVQQSMGEMVFIIIFATAVSLVSESPIMTLEKIILGGGGGSRRGGKPGENRANPTVETDKSTNDGKRPPDGNGNILPSSEPEDVTPSAPVEVEVIQAESLYPQVPSVTTLDQLPTSVELTVEPPPYGNIDSIYAEVNKSRRISSLQVNKPRTLSVGSISTVNESSTGPV